MTGIQHALSITDAGEARDPLPSVRRLYFGHEFCEKLLPDARDLARVADFCQAKGLRLTLVTPPVTQPGLARVGELLDWLEAHQAADEVVINDYGVLHLLRRRHPRLEPVLGRLMSKQQRDPRIMRLLAGAGAPRPVDGRLVLDVALPDEAAALYRATPLSAVRTQRLLRALGVRRVELDNPLHGFDYEGGDDGAAASLYVPFGVVATSRRCTADPRRIARPFTDRLTTCVRDCRPTAFELSAEHIAAPLYRRGNTLFFRNEAVPDDAELTRRHVDRVVHQPHLPM